MRRILTAREQYEMLEPWLGHEAAKPQNTRFEFQRGMYRPGTGDDDPSGFGGLSNLEAEKLIAKNLANGYEPYGDPHYHPGIRWKRVKTKLIQPTSEGSQQVAQVLNGFRANHPDVQIDLPDHVHPQMAGDFFSGLHDMMTKYPHAKVRSLGTTQTDIFGKTRNVVDPRWGGLTAPAGNPFVLNPGDPSDLIVSPAYFNDYDRATKLQQEQIADHFVVPYGSRPPAYTLAAHEFGHVLWHAGGGTASKALNTELRKHFLTLHPELQGQSRLAVDGAYSDWLHEQVPGYGLHPVGGSIPWHEDHPWVGKKPKVKLNEPEALAEAFADVEINGDKASDASKFMHQRLVNLSQGNPQ